jgi:hypothetical protein
MSAPGSADGQVPGGQPAQPEVSPGDREALGSAADQQQAEAEQTSPATEPVPASRLK